MIVSTLPVAEIVPDARHPMEKFLRKDRIPHIWCSGCGLGSALSSFLFALDELAWDPDSVAVVAGIGCTARIPGYLRLDTYHTTHGRAIPFATGLKLAKKDLHVVVISGDGDLFAIGGNHFIHAARRNLDMTVICVNNLTYGMTGGQVGPTTPGEAVASTSPFGNFEEPFNLPYLADSCGAVYVARWTTFHVTQMKKSMKEALLKPGFSFIEVISPCPTLYGRRNKLGDGLDEVKLYKQRSQIKHGADTKECALSMTGPIVVGKFVDRKRPTYHDAMEAHYSRKLGDRYVRLGA
jgi:2-oxoglutarate/2-oxoacid ferredoxin oxidoreductase subunit beta